MKVFLATVAISLCLPGLSNYAQTGRAGGTAGAAGRTGVGVGTAATGVQVVRPTGVLAGQATTITGPSVSAPAGTGVAVPATPTPVGPINPGGITGLPPQTAGRTFGRSIIGGGPTETIPDPNIPQTTFRFPPASTLPPPVVTNTFTGAGAGFPQFETFPPGLPVGSANRPVLGTELGGIGTPPVREPVVVNLPPGARIVTGVTGVPEAVVPPPPIVPTNVVGVGAPEPVQSGNDRSFPLRQSSIPPASPPPVLPPR